MDLPWLEMLRQLVEKRPIAVLRFSETEWDGLQSSRRGVNEFTFARPHSLLENIKPPTPCLLQGGTLAYPQLYFGLVSSRSAVTTLESRVKVRRAVQIAPHSENELLQLVSEAPHLKNFQDRLRDERSVVLLSAKLSSHLVEKLASIERNRGGMRAVTESLSVPKRFQNAAALQEDAVRYALNAFGVGPNDTVVSLELVEGKDTALARVPIMEDSVIEHDARSVPGYDLVHSDLTGRAVFEKGIERLEVFTANRRPLEHVFGVDLIYLNATRQNIVMLQYKMLEPAHGDDPVTDWIYRPDASLEDEISRMKKFTRDSAPGPNEYRLNPSVFFLKFVKRNGMIANGGITIPIEHFEQVLQDPICRGPKGGLRISFQSLDGRYLRQGAFLDLLRSGYIGAHAEVTAHMQVLVEAVLEGNRAVVAAIQSPKDPANRLGNEPDDSDGKAR